MNHGTDSDLCIGATRLVWAGILGLAVLLGGFGSWAALARIAGAIVASGQIEVDRNRQIVQHPAGGVVAEILVTEGDLVAAGDALIRLDATQLQSRFAIIADQLFEVRARRNRLEAERDRSGAIAFARDLTLIAKTDPNVRDLMQGQVRLFAARAASLRHEVAQLEKRRGQIEDQIAGIMAQRQALGTQIELIGEELANQQALLDRGLAQSARVLALRREAARLEGEKGELTALLAQSEGRIVEIDLEVLKLGSNRRETAITRLRDLQFREFELTEEHAILGEEIARLVIRAPVSGVVHGLEVFAERSVIRPAAPILYLVPQDRPLVIASRLQPIHVDQVYLGQMVNLRLSAFDGTGGPPTLRGRVATISADAFTDERTQDRFYRAEIEVLPGETERLADLQVLKPGMPVDVFFRTETRAPIVYLLQPLSDYFVKAFRES